MLLLLKKISCSFLIALCAVSIGVAQNFTTKGVEFWAAYGAHTSMYTASGAVKENGGQQKMVFYFLSPKAAVVTVAIPGISWIKKYAVTAGAVTESDEMPKTAANDVRLLTEGVSDKGIHITSNEQITVYCHIYSFQSSATTLLLPVNICGAAYYTLNQTQHSADKNARSFCFVIATEDSTEIQVTPSANTLTHAADTTFTQMLNKGEVLNLLGATYGKEDNSFAGADLTGTSIHTINQAAGASCKKIIVFSGSSSVNVTCTENLKNSSDNFIQQMPSLEAWGTNFIGIPTLTMPVNTYRAMVLSAAQKVFVNGRRLTSLQEGRYYNFKARDIATIYSDSLMLVAQYITSASQCGNNNAAATGGDPEMMLLTPTGYGITSTIINSTTNNDITSHYINVLMKADDIDSFKLDSITMPERFTVLAQNTNFATAQIEVSPGRHTLESDSTFISYAYGFGKEESYGYNAGFSVQHVAAELGVGNPYKTPDLPITCNATQFRIFFDIAQKPDKLEWYFHGNNQLQPNTDMQLSQPAPDSIFKNNGVRIFRYYLPGFYQYTATGDFPVDVVAYVPDKTGCIYKKNFYFTITAVQKPVASWFLQYDKCANNKLFFTDKSPSFGNTEITQWMWNFGDGTTSGIQNPEQQFANYGEYNVQLRSINDIGCYNDTAQLIGLYHKPVAAFSITGSNCTGEDVLFKSDAFAENDALLPLSWNFTNGSTSAMQNVTKQFADSGDYYVTLIAKNTHNCADTIAKTIHIYQKPFIKLASVLYAHAGDTLRLKPDYKGDIKSYNWAPATFLSSAATPYPLAMPTVDINYSITALSNGSCKAVAATIVKLQRLLNIPSAFTPNGDGLNDYWTIKNLENYTNCIVQVYNRWGNKIFYSRGYSAPWNGTYNGLPLPSGAYYYFINLNNPALKNDNNYSGSISIIK